LFSVQFTTVYLSGREADEMQHWQESYLGLREVPRELSEFELQAFFTFSSTERAVIERRRGPAMKLGLALHLGFVRMSGRPLDAFRVLPVMLLRDLGKELGIPVPDIASLRALYSRGRTLSDHQELACRWLGFSWMTPHQRGALVRVLRDEVVGCADREQLLAHARRWLYEHRLLIVHDRALRALVAAASRELEAETAATIRTIAPPAMWQRWLATTTETRPDGQTTQNWLWAAPAKHSTRQINEMHERIELLVELGVDRVLVDLNAALVRRLARRLAARSPSVSARIKDPARTVEVVCFLRHCLLTASDQLILMVQRRVVDLWRQCAEGVQSPVDWAARYRQLLADLARLSVEDAVPDAELRSRLMELVSTEHSQPRPSRASLIRQRTRRAPSARCWGPSSTCPGRPRAGILSPQRSTSCERSTPPESVPCESRHRRASGLSGMFRGRGEEVLISGEARWVARTPPVLKCASHLELPDRLRSRSACATAAGRRREPNVDTD
jgi:hypothetical protein